MPTLIPIADMLTFLGEDPADVTATALVEPILAQVEALFINQCNRQERPFLTEDDTAAQTEIHDGTGTRLLYLDYPVKELVGIVLGYDPDEPDAELDTTDPAKVQARVGHRRIRRLDGTFGCQDQPGYVHVSYKRQADFPADAVLAIQRRVAAIYLQRGNEDATSERLGGMSSELTNAAEDEVWRQAVGAHRALPG